MTEITVDGVKINLSNIRIDREPIVHPDTGVYLATRWTITGTGTEEFMPPVEE